MAISSSAIDGLFGNIMAAVPTATTFSYSGSTYSGIRTILKSEKQYGFEGMTAQYQFSLIVQVSDFTTVPTVNTNITHNSVTYMIMAVERDAANITARLDLGEDF